MNRSETEYWLDDFMPAKLSVHPAGGVHIGVAEFGKQSIACTTDFARVDTGLQVDGESTPTDVRSELFTVIDGSVIPAVRVLGAAVDVLRKNAAVLPAEPGTMLPDLAHRSGVLMDQFGFDSGITVLHGLLVPPFMWGGPVPQFTEEAGDVHGEGITPGAGRLTVMLQLIILTDEERERVMREGMNRFLREVQAERIAVHNWRR
ncbi:hypothetical protein [Corynebacterium mastitidis]|uniref:hypothetical protein n=1 Tax=Corynebacterium mastitidis TaxID=161890 RepID=UPI00254EE11F|nr:hypothetical protein [Corynebacterium mastitidis]MDK8450160.1 hypothetical protein [Corynebacterium mastitidis]